MVSYQCFEMINGGDQNPYHLFFIMIANFLLADTDNNLIIYYYPVSKHKLAEEALALLPPMFIRHTTKNPEYEYFPFAHTIPIFRDIALSQSYSLIRKLYKIHISSEMIRGRSIYIARRNGPRSITNHEELTKAIPNFEVIYLEDYSVKEQIRIVSEAQNIIGPHGAGLSFTVFCHPAANVIELYPKDTSELKHFAHIAHVLGHSFFRFQAVELLDDGNLVVDTTKLKDFLKLWLLHTPPITHIKSVPKIDVPPPSPPAPELQPPDRS